MKNCASFASCYDDEAATEYLELSPDLYSLSFYAFYLDEEDAKALEKELAKSKDPKGKTKEKKKKKEK